MFLFSYFSALSALAHVERLPIYSSKMLLGAWPHGLNYLQQRRDALTAIDDTGQALSLLCANGDALLVLEYQEEAEETYRLVHKFMRGRQRQLRLLSCRNTAWQMLTQRRLNAALSCFSQIVMDREAEVRLCAESLLGKALTHFHLGQSVLAQQSIERVEDMLCEFGTHARDWLRVVTALRLDMQAQLHIRRAERLSDHVFWQTMSRQKEDIQPINQHDLQQCIEDLIGPMPVLATRLRYVHGLLRVAENDITGFDAQIDGLSTCAIANGPGARHDAKVELALAALAAGRSEFAERALAGVGYHTMLRWDLEFEYCQAKICNTLGRPEQTLSLYHRYARNAVQCLRNEIQVPRIFDTRGGASFSSDDISTRLPAKYRRAYAYMIANAYRADLSVSEVAAQIGVTGRALQQTFKSATGLSPTQVLRRYRMQCIRDELLAEGGCAGVLQAASRWGVVSRSALVKGYRQHFNEAPVETLQR